MTHFGKTRHRQRHSHEKTAFMWMLVAASIAFIWVLLPFFAPILWACVLAILFHPANNYLRNRYPNRITLTSILTMVFALFIVVLPIILIVTTVANEAAALFKAYDAGEIDLEPYFENISDRLPALQHKLNLLHISPENLKSQVNSAIAETANFITKQSLSIGQNTLAFFLNTGLTLYLTYFMFRDGDKIMKWMHATLPLSEDHEARLFRTFYRVTRATIKGNLLVAFIQGLLGVTIFWLLDIRSAFLWGGLMAFASMIPAVGTALIWGPIAIFFLVTGETQSGVILSVYGIGVIGMADNILRPIFVGRDSKLPDYIVLLTTLGGLALIGINGFVVGPLIAAMFLSLWTMFMVEFKPDRSQNLSTPFRAETDTPATDDAEAAVHMQTPPAIEGRAPIPAPST